MFTILISHNSASKRNLFFDFLSDFDFHVTGFENGDDLFAHAQEIETADLIILEANSQNFSVCQKIRVTSWGKRIPIIIILNVEDASSFNDAFTVDVDEFITTPLNGFVIRQQIRILLDRTKAQQEIERKFRSIFDTAVDPIIIIDSDGIIHFVNHATTRAFGYSEKDLLGNKINLLIPEPWSSSHDRYIQDYLITGKSRIIGVGREVSCLHRDGHIFSMHLAVSQVPVSSDKKILFTGILHDISKRILIENELRQQKNYMEEERRVIEGILTRMHRASPFEKNALHILNQPVENTSGDLLLSSSRPNGTKHIFLGDFTGHGLSAALVGPLVTDIFYSMTKKGFAPDQILAEINKKLHKKLPASLFLAGCFVELDPIYQHLLIWNGGLPQVKIMRKGVIVTRVSSHALPLGILSTDQFDPAGKSIGLAPGDQVVIFTDGITETRSITGEMFSDSRFENLLETIIKENRPLEEIITILSEFRGYKSQEDDITLAVVSLESEHKLN
ncbi:two-component system, HptB-dependent secretion and biofilm response regulator [Gammaproteobacteria bacterium]